MSASPAPAVDVHAAMDSAAMEDNLDTAAPATIPAVAEPVAADIGNPPAGLFGTLRNGLLGLGAFVTRMKTTMTEVDSMYKQTWNGGRPGTRPGADVPIPHSTTARILSEAGELLAEATMREDANGSALLRLEAPRSLPAKAIVRTDEDEVGRLATVKWTGGASAIVEFDQ